MQYNTLVIVLTLIQVVTHLFHFKDFKQGLIYTWIYGFMHSFIDTLTRRVQGVPPPRHLSSSNWIRELKIERDGWTY